MKTLRENLLLQFSIIAFLILGIVIFLTIWSLKGTLENLVLEESTEEAVAIVSKHVSNQITPEDLREPFTGDRYEAFNKYMQRYIVSPRIARIKLWDTQGRVIFSTDETQVGRTFPIEEGLASALKGGIGREISIPQKAENEQERILGTLIEIYAPVRRPGSDEVVGAFEIYQYFAPFARFINEHNRTLYATTISGSVILYLSLLWVVMRGWRTILNQRKDIDMRFREVQGLNNLMRQHLAEHDRTVEAFQKLGAAPVALEILNKEQVVEEYHRLKIEVERLTKEVSRSPLLDGPEIKS